MDSPVDVAVALAVTLAGAFCFLDRCDLFRYQIAREEGNRLYFKTAFWAVIFFVAAMMLRNLVSSCPILGSFDRYIANLAVPLSREGEKQGAQAYSLVTALYAFLLSICAPAVSNMVTDRIKQLERAVSKDELELLLYVSVRDQKPVSLTLDGGKVYVGFVISNVQPLRDREWFSILPLLSGHRSPAGKIQFTTNYFEQIYQSVPGSPFYFEEKDDSRLKGLSLDDFCLVLPVEKVLGINFFDLRVYNAFNPAT